MPRKGNERIAVNLPPSPATLKPATSPIGLFLTAGGLLVTAFWPWPWPLAGGVMYAAGLAVRPWLAVPAIVLTLPYYLHPRVFGGIEVSTTEVAILVGAAGVLIRAAGERAHASFRGPVGEDGGVRGDAHAVRMPSPSMAEWAVAALLGSALASLLVTEYPRQSLREIRWFVLEPIVVFYVARATSLTGGQAIGVLWSIVLSAALAAAIGMGAVVANEEPGDFSARATWPYLSPNHLGLFLGRGGAVALAIALFARYPAAIGRYLQPAAWLALAAIVLGLLKTLSLGAWIGFMAAALTLAALRGRRSLVVTAATCAILALAAVVFLPADRTTGRLDPASGTGLFRLHVWQASARMIADHPITGVGLDNFLYLYRRGYMSAEAWREPNISHPHNWILDFWLRLGLPGLATAVGLIGWTGLTAIRLFRRAHSAGDRVVAAASGAVLADFLVHGSFDNSYFLVDLAVLWWLVIALLAVRHSTPDRRHRGDGVK